MPLCTAAQTQALHSQCTYVFKYYGMLLSSCEKMTVNYHLIVKHLLWPYMHIGSAKELIIFTCFFLKSSVTWFHLLLPAIGQESIPEMHMTWLSLHFGSTQILRNQITIDLQHR